MASIRNLKAFNFQSWIEEIKRSSSRRWETRKCGKTVR